MYKKEAEVASTGNPLIPKDALKKLRGSDGTEGRNIEMARPCKAGDDSEGDDEVDAGENVADREEAGLPLMHGWHRDGSGHPTHGT